jgi:hypothetical protein
MTNVRTNGFAWCLVLGACGSSTTPAGANLDAHGATSDAPRAHDGGEGSDAGSPAAPTSITLTGSIAVSCKLFPAPPTEYDCDLGVANLVMSPAPPEGTEIDAAIGIGAENKSSPDTGWISGLTVSKPAYPSTCVQDITWFGSAAKLMYSVYGIDESQSDCGLGNVADTDFASGFTAQVNVTWSATGTVVPATLTFTP